MSFRVVTPVAVEPVTLADARLHLRVGSDDTTEDSLILVWITVAREYAEAYTRRALATQTLELALDRFPGSPPALPAWTWSPEDSAFVLDKPPVSSISSIKYTDPQGVEQTLDPSKYALSPYGTGSMVYPTYGNPWPATQATRNAVRVQYVAGYSAPPQAVKAAILLIVGHLYENRQDVYVDGRVAIASVPNGADALLDTVKLYGL